MKRIVLCSMLVTLAACAPDNWSTQAGEAAEYINQYRNAVATAQQAQSDGDQALYQERMALANAAQESAARTLEGMPVDRVRSLDTLAVYTEAHALADNADLVVEGLERLAALEPANSEHVVRRALVLAEMSPSRASEALQSTRQALQLTDLPSARRAQLFSAHGRLAHEAGLYDLAAEAYNEALALDASLPWPPLGAALLLVHEGALAEAAAAIDAYGPIPPDIAVRFSRLLDEGLRAFDTSGLRIPDDPTQHLAYARLLIRDSRFGDALLPLRRATHQAPANFVAWNMLGSVAANLGETTVAREAFERSLAIEPDQPRTRQSLEGLPR